jgi:hypothetical protein
MQKEAALRILQGSFGTICMSLAVATMQILVLSGMSQTSQGMDLMYLDVCGARVHPCQRL